MPRAVIFDLLTALLDSWTIWETAVHDRQKGHKWRSRYLKLAFECGAYRPYDDLVREAAQQVNLPDTAADTLFLRWHEMRPWPEASSIVGDLRSRGYQVGIISNCSAELGRQALTCLGPFTNYAFVSAEEAGFYKPHHKAYEHILSVLKVNPRDALFVAGSNGDVIGAANAGMDVVWHNRMSLEALPGSAPLHEAKSLRVLLRDLLGCKGLQRWEIPTPSLYLNRNVFEANCKRMHARVCDLKATFRAHVKTHKTVEGTGMEIMPGDGRIACSTLKEIEHVGVLISRGEVRSVLYAIPPAKSSLPRLASLRRRLRRELILMIDHPSQIDLIQDFKPSNTPWPIFISVDCGDHREGIQLTSNRLRILIQHALNSNSVYIYGFYTHAGHSYSVTSHHEAEGHLENEIDHVNAAARLCREYSDPKQHLTLSVGATPTAQAAFTTATEALDPNTTLELHAGNFTILDLQQTATSIAPLSHIASWVEVEVLSVYPERRELLINLGTLGIGREPGREPGLWGLAKLVTENLDDKKEEEGYSWNLVRISQEHGILAPRLPGVEVEGVSVGTRARVLPQHACIAGAMHDSYVVVDMEDGVCVEEWVRCRGW